MLLLVLLLLCAAVTAAGAPPIAGGTVLEFEEGSKWTPFVRLRKGCATQWTDSVSIAWHNRATNTSTFYGACHKDPHGATGTTLDDISARPVCTAVPVLKSFNNHTPESYANMQWLQSVRVFANGTAAGITHTEFHGELEPLGKYCPHGRVRGDSGACMLFSAGLAKSNDLKTFHQARSPPDHLIAAPANKFILGQPEDGVGPISPMLLSDDGYYYGSMNWMCQSNYSRYSNLTCQPGNCIFRSADLTDPRSFRGRDQDGNFTVQWESAYAPGGVPATMNRCAVIPSDTDETPFGFHVTYRRIVRPSNSTAGGQEGPTFIAFGDTKAHPKTGLTKIKYSFTSEPDFGQAMSGDVLSKWSKAQTLDLESDDIFYPMLMDVRSPQLGVLLGRQEDGDSYALISYPDDGDSGLYMFHACGSCHSGVMRRKLHLRTAVSPPGPPSPPPPDAPALHCPGIAVQMDKLLPRPLTVIHTPTNTDLSAPAAASAPLAPQPLPSAGLDGAFGPATCTVSGAGSKAVNGNYTKTRDGPEGAVYSKDTYAADELYQWKRANEWKFGKMGKELYYEAKSASSVPPAADHVEGRWQRGGATATVSCVPGGCTRSTSPAAGPARTAGAACPAWWEPAAPIVRGVHHRAVDQQQQDAVLCNAR